MYSVLGVELSQVESSQDQETHQRRAHWALRRTQGTVSMALRSLCFSAGFLM